MSVTLATITDALIEFILSLLRDPSAAAEFDEDPQGALASRGLGNVTAADVCAVAPVIADRSDVAGISVAATPSPTPAPRPAPEPVDPVVREIKSVTNSLTYVDNHNTIVDQSVNQNIWANGDVTQLFDQEAVVASGEDSVAAGDDATLENTLDQSTDINAGDDVLIDSEKTETETNTDSSTDTTVVDSGNTATDTQTVDDSFTETTVDYTEQNVDSDTNAVFASEDAVIEDTAPDDNF